MAEEASEYKIQYFEMDEKHLRPRGLCGLANIGNTCYMNSALQALSNCPQLTQYFLKCHEFLTIPNGEKLLVAKCYRDLISQLWNKKRPKQLTPSALLKSIRIHNSMFRGYYQQDTQEFLRCLMDRLHEDMKIEVNEFIGDETENYESEDFHQNNTSGLLGGNAGEILSQKKRKKRGQSSSTQHSSSPNHPGSPKNGSQDQSKTSQSKKDKQYRSIITSIFDGKLLSSVQCLTCNRVSSTIETFQDLSLPIPSMEELKRMHTQTVLSCAPTFYEDTNWMFYIWNAFKGWFVGPTIKLEDCLAAFFTNDELKGDNMYSCEKCKKLRNGVKYSRVHHLPEVLCIHLKRFRHELYHSSKINTYISFPLYNLDVSHFLSKDFIKSKRPSKYNLSAVICHFGSVGGGHYIAYAKNCIDNKWYEYNDSMVEEADETTVINAEAYVLFYSMTDEDSDEFRKDINTRLHTNQQQEFRLKKNSKTFISKEWFTRYDSCVQPGPITNGDVLCEHRSVKPCLSECIKDRVVAIPDHIYKVFVERFGGGPTIRSLDVCITCREMNKRKEFELKTFEKLHQEFQSIVKVEVVYHISIQWYDKWYAFVSNQTNETPGAIDNSDIKIDEVYDEKEDDSYGCISEDTWRFLQSQYGGGPEVFYRKKLSDEEAMET